MQEVEDDGVSAPWADSSAIWAALDGWPNSSLPAGYRKAQAQEKRPRQPFLFFFFLSHLFFPVSLAVREPRVATSPL